MRFVIDHQCRYRYDVPVALGTHTLRLSPNSRDVRVQSQELCVAPDPSNRTSRVDRFGNRVIELEFLSTSRELCIDSHLVVDTLPPPALPWNLPLLPWAFDASLPIEYYGRAVATPAVRTFAEALARETNFLPVPFLDRLASAVFERTSHGFRLNGPALAGADTLATGRGACRDFAVLFMEASRCLGIASCFVSGYQSRPQGGGASDPQSFLHAWAEVSLPGFGYFAWDPTHGIRVDEAYVALARAPDQADTMPVEGLLSFESGTMNSTLDSSVRIATA